MKITALTSTRPLLSIAGVLSGSIGGVGPPGSVPIAQTGANGSNGVAWGSNVQLITADASNKLLGPFVNFASGSNVIFTFDGMVGSTPSNTLRIHSNVAAGGGGTTITTKDEGSTLSTTVTTLDFVGAGVTASGGGATTTVTISGGGSTAHEDGFTKPDSAGTYDEEFEGTADTLPTNWSWISTPSTWKLNSQWKSWLIVDHAASTSETKELRRASFTPGANDWGLWWYWDMGLGRWNNNSSWTQLDIANSGETESEGVRITKSSVLGITHRQMVASVESDVGAENGSNNDTRAGVFCGITRKNSDTTWRVYVSSDGISWVQVVTAHSHSFTVDRIRIRFNSGSNEGIERHALDFVRYRTDLLLWAPR